MANLSLLAASLVLALLGWGWLDAVKDGAYDFLDLFKRVPAFFTDDGYSGSDAQGRQEGMDDELDDLDDELESADDLDSSELRELEAEF